MTLEHEAVKKAVLSETMQLLETGGLDAVKARPIATKVGVSVGTIYNMFGSLEGLLQEASSMVLSHFAASASVFIIKGFDKIDKNKPEDAQEEVVQRLLVLADAYIDYISDNHIKWSAMIAFNRDRKEGKADDWYLSQQQSLFKWIADLIAQTPHGTDDEMIENSVRTLWSSVHGIVSLNFIGWKESQAKENTRQMIELLVRNYIAGIYRTS